MEVELPNISMPLSILELLRTRMSALRFGSSRARTDAPGPRDHLRGLRFLAPFTLLLLITGCLPRRAAPDLVIINGNEPESLDPAIVTGISEMRITKALFEGLVRLDPKTAAPVPGLADRWALSADGAAYTFHLRASAAWSTGEPITTQDVLYSWRRTISPATAADYAGQLFCKIGRASCRERV